MSDEAVEIEKLEVTDATQRILSRFDEHMPKVDDITLVTLKGHLLLEEQLVEITEAAVERPAELPDLRFAARLKLVKAIHPGKYVEPFTIIEALNKLRNELAHKLESEKQDELVESVILKHLRVMKQDARQESRAADLRLAVIFSLGFLTDVLRRVKETQSAAAKE